MEGNSSYSQPVNQGAGILGAFLEFCLTHVLHDFYQYEYIFNKIELKCGSRMCLCHKYKYSTNKKTELGVF